MKASVRRLGAGLLIGCIGVMGLAACGDPEPEAKKWSSQSKTIEMQKDRYERELKKKEWEAKKEEEKRKPRLLQEKEYKDLMRGESEG